MSTQRYIENEGALFRGGARAWPLQVWDSNRKTWSKYTGDVPKGVDWGDVITTEAAEAQFPGATAA